MPRATTIEFGTSHDGISLGVSEKGIEVWGWFDGIVGIEGGFLSWDEIQKLRDRACKKKKKGGDALDLMRDAALGVR